MINDTYFTIEKDAQGGVFKDKGSKFYGYIFYVTSEQEVKERIDLLKEEHYKARHWCYAYMLGTFTKKYRANDDGEPSNSAGQPILGQIKSFDLTNVLIVVVRYFGGTKLGVGGLISAYKEGAKLAIEASKIVKKTIDVHLKLTFTYEHLNKIMRVIKDNKLDIVSQSMEMECELIVSMRLADSDRIEEVFKNLRCAKVKKVD